MGDVVDPLRLAQELLARLKSGRRLPGPAPGAGALRIRTGPGRLGTLPVDKVSPAANLMVRDVALVRTGIAARQIDRDAVAALRSILVANVEGEDMGRGVARRSSQAIAAAGEPPRGVRVMHRGQFRR